MGRRWGRAPVTGQLRCQPVLGNSPELSACVTLLSRDRSVPPALWVPGSALSVCARPVGALAFGLEGFQAPDFGAFIIRQHLAILLKVVLYFFPRT